MSEPNDDPEPRTPIQHQINQEIYKAIEKLGGNPDLLSIIGSIGDTLPDEEILFQLRRYNSGPGFSSIHLN